MKLLGFIFSAIFLAIPLLASAVSAAEAACQKCVAIESEILQHQAESTAATRELRNTQRQLEKLPEGPSPQRSKLTSALIIYYARLETAKNRELTAKKARDSQCRACSDHSKKVAQPE